MVDLFSSLSFLLFCLHSYSHIPQHIYPFILIHDLLVFPLTFLLSFTLSSGCCSPLYLINLHHLNHVSKHKINSSHDQSEEIGICYSYTSNLHHIEMQTVPPRNSMVFILHNPWGWPEVVDVFRSEPHSWLKMGQKLAYNHTKPKFDLHFTIGTGL